MGFPFTRHVLFVTKTEQTSQGKNYSFNSGPQVGFGKDTRVDVFFIQKEMD